MNKIFEPELISSIITGYVEDLVTTKGNLPASKPFELAIKPITEYDGRMRVKATDIFDVAVYIAAVSFYLNQGDMKMHRARGAMVLYMDIEVADKIFKVAGYEVPYDEDDESMMTLCGQLGQQIAEGFKERLAAQGYAVLETSPVTVYKNSIAEGVEFSKEQTEKQEISFYFLKHKAMVIDWTMSPIPKQ